MNGPAHYQEAERLLALADATWGIDSDATILAAAQVHATLALAAATVDAATVTDAMLSADIEAWGRVL